MNSAQESPRLPAGTVVEFVCCDVPEDVPQRSGELANCRDFGSVVAVFVGRGQSKVQAVRSAIDAAPGLYADYRRVGGPF